MRIKINWSLTAFLVFFGAVLWLLFDTHIIQSDKYGNLLTGESTYGDLPFHLSQISQMSYGKIFPPENPLFAGHPLTYPYAINFLSSLMVNIGMSLRDSIILPGMFFSILTAWGLYFFYKAISRSHSVALTATFLFWFNGGLGFFYFFRDIVLKGQLNGFLENPGKFSDYSHLFTENIQWNNFLSRIVVPERSVLLGIPIGILVLYLLFVKKKAGLNWEFFVSSILTGLLPIIHTHTFLVLGITIPLLALFDLRGSNFKRWVLRWAVFAGVTLVISLPWLLEIFNQVGNSQGFFKYKFGWMAKEGPFEFIFFWIKNAGILIPLMIFSLFVKAVPFLVKKLTIVGLVIITLINVFQFQPYDWDNIKFLFWAGVFGSLSAALILQFICVKWKTVGRVVVTLLFLGLTTSSYISLYREVKLQHVLFSKEEVELGTWVREKTPREAIFLTAPIHNSFVNNFGGRRILMGYPGMLWVHGINYQSQEKAMKEIYKGSGNATKLLRDYQISYVVIGPRELVDLKANSTYFDSNYCLEVSTENYKIYAVNCNHE